MPRKKLDIIDLEEFNRRLNTGNERKRLELDHREANLDQVEQLLSRYETALDEVEAKMRSKEKTSDSNALRRRLQELATKTAEMASSL